MPLEGGLRPFQKLVLRTFKLMLGDAPGPVLIASYNKPFFGNDWARCMKEGMRGALGFLEALTLRPSAVTAESVHPLRAAGLSDRAIREVVYVCFLFNTLDRLADALNFPLPTEEGAEKIENLAFRLGYGIAKLPG